MKNITLSADKNLIEAARARARAEKTTLNEQFRQWLAHYARDAERLRNYEAVVEDLRGRLSVGQSLDRDQRNAR